MPLLDLWLAQLHVGLLVFLRLAAAFFLLPPLGARQVPPAVRLGAAAAVTLLATPLVMAKDPPLPQNALAFMATAAQEVLVGLALGWLGALAIHAAQMAGELMDAHAGFNMATLIHPATDLHVSLLGQFKFLLASLLYLGVGAHHLTLAGLVESYDVCAIGSAAFAPTSLGMALHAVSRMVALAVQVASPVTAALFLAEVALGIANRALPQLNVMILSLSLKGLLALAVLAACLPVAALGLGRLALSVGNDLSLLARSLGG